MLWGDRLGSLLQPEWIHFYFFYRLEVWSDFIWRVASTALQVLKITGPQCAFSRNSGSTVWVNTHYPKMASPSRKNRNYTRRWLWDHWSVFLKSKELHKHWFGEVTRPLAKLWGNPLIYLFHWEMGSYHFACLIKDSPMLLLRNLSHFIWHQGCTIPPWTCRLAEVTNAAEQTLLCLLS